MQKKLVALAVLGLISSAAFAETSVVIGGKFDAGYQFKRTANPDAQCGTTNYCGGNSTETLGDGSASTSRITIQAKEDLMPGWNAMVDLDLRFGTVEEGKTGLNNNDKKALYLSSPFGTLRWGVMNLANQQFWDYEEKPYMIAPKDLEIVKYGVSEKRNSSLSNRATEFDTPVLTLGPVKTRLKATYAIGDNQKAGTNNVDSGATGPQGSGNAGVVSWTGAFGDLVNWGFSTGNRETTSNLAAARNGMHFQEHYINIHPIKALKIGMNYNIYKGYGDTTSGGGYGAFKEKNTNFVVSYNINDRIELGFERSHLNDLASSRNSGKGWMVGGAYFLSKGTYVYLAHAKEDYANNVKGVTGGYNGTGTGFIGNFDKLDNTYTRVGLVKEF